MANEKDIKYINREFGDFKTQLIEFAKNYFGDQSVDFRNRYRVTYLCSDFDGNHTFEVKGLTI